VGHKGLGSLSAKVSDLLRKKETKDKDLLLMEQVVLQVTEEYAGKHHHVYFNNFLLQ
jgi:hypothetical protein